MADKIMEIALRRGFIFPSYEIYSGASGFYDYGPLGAGLKKNIEDLWRKFFCLEEGFMEISTPTIAPEEVFMASGHLESFTDPVVECSECRSFFRADHLLEAYNVQAGALSIDEMNRLIDERGTKCLECSGKLGEVKDFNLMFRTSIGRKTGYLRPETAQGIFILFNRLHSFYRKKVPFGVAQLGRAYRNEISPRQGLIRLREFSQAELEIFISPDDKTHEKFGSYAGEKLKLLPAGEEEARDTAIGRAVEQGTVVHEFLGYYIVRTRDYLLACGIPEERLRFRQHLKEEMAHYAKDCWDAEVYTRRFGWVETVGIADRTDYDLRAHEKVSGEELKAFKEYSEPKIVKKRRVEPVMRRLGPRFKGKAKKIAGQIRAISPSEAKGNLSLKVDGEEVSLDESYYRVRESQEKITGEKYYPHVVEPSFGIDRILYALLDSSYGRRDGKNVLKIPPALAPIKVSVFPLVKKEPLTTVARNIHEELKGASIYTSYDENDSIGRRYARSDEAGVPYAVTVDYEGLEDSTATLRERDSTGQIRVKTNRIAGVVEKLVRGEVNFKEINEAH